MGHSLPQLIQRLNRLDMIILNVSGNITADATVKTINGVTVTSFTIASNTRYKTKNGTVTEEVNFIRCAIWNKPELAALLNKGRGINATGKFKPNYWNDDKGVRQISLDMRVSFFQLFGSNKKSSNTETFVVPSAPVTDEEANAIEKDLPF